MRKGEKMSDSQKEKIRLSNLGQKRSPETIEKIRISKKGIPPSTQNREATRRALIGNKFALGHKDSEETRRKKSIARIGYKTSPEAIRKSALARTGEKNYGWRGGHSREPYVLGWSSITKNTRDRDEHLCQHPGCYLSEFKEKHHVHHIDFDKSNNDPGNLITLCRGHHVSTYAGDISYWVGFYQSIQEMRGINPHRKGGF